MSFNLSNLNVVQEYSKLGTFEISLKRFGCISSCIEIKLNSKTFPKLIQIIEM